MKGGPLQRVEISRAALVHNIREFRRLVGPRRKFLAVVKANAYGHGLSLVARVAAESGVDWLGVNSVEEGAALRDGGLNLPILVLGYAPLRDLGEAVARDLRLVVYNKETAARLAREARKAGKTAAVHVKVETGTHRQGVAARDVASFVRNLRAYGNLVVEGLSSHFANIEDTTRHDYPRRQLDAFRAAVAEVEAEGGRIPLKHMSCTASTILFPETDLGLARVGIGLYGYWPSTETYVSCLQRRRTPLSLKPVLSWRAAVAQVKRIPRDAFVGCTYRTTRRTTLAVVPVGYYDGYDRGLSNAAHVLVRGHRAPVRGRVAMDFLMADVTDISGVRLEDEATLIGSDGEERVTAADLAGLAGTISYEILARINPLIPRQLV